MASNLMIIIGGHVSAAGGVLKSLDRATELGFASIQIHPTGPQSWSRPTTTDEVSSEFATRYPALNIQSVFFHNIYLNNFASENNPGWHGSIGISQSYMQLAAKMQVSGIVTHLGSHKGAGMAAVLERVCEGLERVLAESPAATDFIIENTAGAGGTIGRSLEEIEMIWERIIPHYPNLGICIDTCHTFAAGIPIHTTEGLEQFIQEFKNRFGIAALKIIHLNDSKFPFGSLKDRHENLGFGHLGDEALSRILQHPELQSIPFVMEVPGLEGHGPDVANREHAEKLATS